MLGRNPGIKTFWFRGHANVGDALTPYLFPRYGINVTPSEATGAELFGVGSILKHFPSAPHALMLGSGLIRREQAFSVSLDRACAVRGPLTARNLGLEGKPVIFGDPGILLTPPAGAIIRYKVGLVPHYVDKDDATVNALKDRHGDDLAIVDVEHNDVDRFVRDLASCDVVVSSSLHGQIIAWALGKPTAWMCLSGKVVGRGFKFHDFYRAFGQEAVAHTLSGAETLDALQALCREPAEGISQMRANLEQAFANARRLLYLPTTRVRRFFTGYGLKGR